MHRVTLTLVPMALIVLTSVVGAYAAQEQEIEEARRRYPPEMTSSLLRGKIPSPEGFDRCVIERMGQERLNTLRAGAGMVSGRENDIAALCLLRLDVPPETLKPLTRDERLPAGGIGSVRFRELQGVALDDQYFYLSDAQARRIYVWEGLPSQNSEPRYVLDTEQPIGRLSSDGKYLAATSGPIPSAFVAIFKVAELRWDAQPVAIVRQPGFNLPGGALLANGHFFVADTVFGRVLAWSRIEDAIAGRNPDVVLGKDNLNDRTPQIGRNKLFWPGALSFNGNYLWVGEFKFSGRILHFSSNP